jgi:cytochrome c-type biogenesis protein CcmH/NrfF
LHLLTERFVFCALIFSGAFGLSMASGQTPTQGPGGVKTSSGQLDKVAQRVSRLSDQMQSPYCKGKTLKTCTSPNAAFLRRKIQKMMRTGKSDAEIIKILQVEFPETKLINPEQPWYTFFVPFLPYIFGASALLFVLLAWRRGAQPERVAMADIDSLSEDISDSEARDDRLARLRSRVQHDD